jgi:hypothetical protein
VSVRRCDPGSSLPKPPTKCVGTKPGAARRRQRARRRRTMADSRRWASARRRVWQRLMGGGCQGREGRQEELWTRATACNLPAAARSDQ